MFNYLSNTNFVYHNPSWLHLKSTLKRKSQANNRNFLLVYMDIPLSEFYIGDAEQVLTIIQSTLFRHTEHVNPEESAIAHLLCDPWVNVFCHLQSLYNVNSVSHINTLLVGLYKKCVPHADYCIPYADWRFPSRGTMFSFRWIGVFLIADFCRAVQ